MLRLNFQFLIFCILGFLLLVLAASCTSKRMMTVECAGVFPPLPFPASDVVILPSGLMLRNLEGGRVGYIINSPCTIMEETVPTLQVPK